MRLIEVKKHTMIMMITQSNAKYTTIWYNLTSQIYNPAISHMRIVKLITLLVMYVLYYSWPPTHCSYVETKELTNVCSLSVSLSNSGLLASRLASLIRTNKL